MTLTVYGIPNCDTVKKARAWLDQNSIPYAFHDYKKLGIDRARLSGWTDQVGWEVLLNRRGTTFRALPPEEKEGLNAARAISVMAAHPSCIKRPVIEHAGGLLVGFDAQVWNKALY